MSEKYYIVLPEDLIINGYQYEEGLNTDTDICEIYNIHTVLEFCCCGSKIADVIIPDGEIIMASDEEGCYNAHSIIISNIRDLWDTKTFKELSDEGADLYFDNGYLSKHYALTGNFDMVEFLLKHEASLHAEAGSFASFLQGKYIDLTKWVLQHGTLKCCNDILKIAASNGYFGVVELIVGYVSNLNTNYVIGAHAISPDIDYALLCASKNGHLDIARYLLEHGANIHAYDDCALSFAAGNGHLDVVRCLLEHGANIHADDDYAVACAAENNHLGIVRYLLEHGANIHADDAPLR